MILDASMSRRRFLAACAAGASAAWGGCTTAALSRSMLDSVFPVLTDEHTGARVYVLTPGDAEDQVIYQTHPKWTPQMEYLVFLSNRTGEHMSPHTLEMATGRIKPVVGGRPVQFSMAWNSAKLFYFQERELFLADVVECFHGKPPLLRLGVMPEQYPGFSGGVSVDADGETVYVGVVLEEDLRWGIAAFNAKRQEWRTVVETDWRVGHVQANPFVRGQIMFCHETGGDAPQRTWFVNADGSGLRPFYKETYDEWVTHEVWWEKDRIIFTIWPYDDAHRGQPHGIAQAWLDKPGMEIISEYPAWHTDGSRDGQWAMGDDFDRNIWLVRMADKERRLLTGTHVSEGFKTHPHGSFTPDSRALVFNSSKRGAAEVMYAPLAEWESLPKA